VGRGDYGVGRSVKGGETIDQFAWLIVPDIEAVCILKDRLRWTARVLI
jgi:hypothetical protein